MSRSPLQTRLASQTNIPALTTSQVTVEFFLKEWIRDAQQAFKSGRKKEGLLIAERIMRLCAEEIARAYNQTFWRNCTTTGNGFARARAAVRCLDLPC